MNSTGHDTMASSTSSGFRAPISRAVAIYAGSWEGRQPVIGYFANMVVTQAWAYKSIKTDDEVLFNQAARYNGLGR